MDIALVVYRICMAIAICGCLYLVCALWKRVDRLEKDRTFRVKEGKSRTKPSVLKDRRDDDDA